MTLGLLVASENANKVLSKFGLRHVLSWPKLGLGPKFHDPGSFGGFGKRGQTNKQGSCFISIDRYQFHYSTKRHNYDILDLFKSKEDGVIYSKIKCI